MATQALAPVRPSIVGEAKDIPVTNLAQPPSDLLMGSAPGTAMSVFNPLSSNLFPGSTALSPFDAFGQNLSGALVPGRLQESMNNMMARTVAMLPPLPVINVDIKESDKEIVIVAVSDRVTSST